MGEDIQSIHKDTQKIFVVHGRNEKARNALFQFLRSIGLKPIEWSQAVRATGKGAPYIGEILDTAFSIAQAVVVLMTPDDFAYLREELREEDEPQYETLPTLQARPNVLFEAGMAMGRYPDRTVLVELGELRPFSDIGGRHSVRLSNSPRKRQDLADRLAIAGCHVDLTGRDWYDAGDFDSIIEFTSRNPAQTQFPPFQEPTSLSSNHLGLTEEDIQVMKALFQHSIRTGNRTVFLKSFTKSREGEKFTYGVIDASLQNLCEANYVEKLSNFLFNFASIFSAYQRYYQISIRGIEEFAHYILPEFEQLLETILSIIRGKGSAIKREELEKLVNIKKIWLDYLCELSVSRGWIRCTTSDSTKTIQLTDDGQKRAGSSI